MQIVPQGDTAAPPRSQELRFKQDPRHRLESRDVEVRNRKCFHLMPSGDSFVCNDMVVSVCYVGTGKTSGTRFHLEPIRDSKIGIGTNRDRGFRLETVDHPTISTGVDRLQSEYSVAIGSYANLGIPNRFQTDSCSRSLPCSYVAY